MKSLGINWFIEGSIDFEHKKYILLDYLQEINRHFDRSKFSTNGKSPSTVTFGFGE